MSKGVAISKAYNYFYKITNLINNKFYYGVRSCYCDPEDDPYMGSGTVLHRAYNKYGVENFRKDVLKVLPTREDVLDLERWIVDPEMIRNPMCYNISLGGIDGITEGLSVAFDKKESKIVVIPQKEFYSNLDRYEGASKNYISVYDTIEDTNKRVHISEFYSNRDRYIVLMLLTGNGFVKVIDGTGTEFTVKYNDPRLLSGELKRAPKSKRISDEEVSRRISEGKKRYYRESGAKSPEYGVRRTYVNNGVIHKKVLDEEVESYLNNNWILGRLESELSSKVHSELLKARKGKFRKMTNGVDNIEVSIDEVPNYLEKNWWIGQTRKPLPKRKAMNKDGIVKMIPEDMIEDFLSKGWNLGSLPRKN